jgi:hypothetical protein
MQEANQPLRPTTNTTQLLVAANLLVELVRLPKPELFRAALDPRATTTTLPRRLLNLLLHILTT